MKPVDSVIASHQGPTKMAPSSTRINPVPSHRTTRLSLAHKDWIVQFKVNWERENNQNQYEADQCDVLKSAAWRELLTNYLLERDSSVTAADVMRWCRSHTWITQLRGKPKNFARTALKRLNNNSPSKANQDRYPVLRSFLATHPLSTTTTETAGFRDQNQMPHSSTSQVVNAVDSSGRNCEYNNANTSQDENDSDGSPRPPTLSPQGAFNEAISNSPPILCPHPLITQSAYELSKKQARSKKNHILGRPEGNRATHSDLSLGQTHTSARTAQAQDGTSNGAFPTTVSSSYSIPDSLADHAYVQAEHLNNVVDVSKGMPSELHGPPCPPGAAIIRLSRNHTEPTENNGTGTAGLESNGLPHTFRPNRASTPTTSHENENDVNLGHMTNASGVTNNGMPQGLPVPPNQSLSHAYQNAGGNYQANVILGQRCQTLPYPISPASIVDLTTAPSARPGLGTSSYAGDSVNQGIPRMPSNNHFFRTPTSSYGIPQTQPTLRAPNGISHHQMRHNHPTSTASYPGTSNGFTHSYGRPIPEPQFREPYPPQPSTSQRLPPGLSSHQHDNFRPEASAPPPMQYAPPNRGQHLPTMAGTMGSQRPPNPTSRRPPAPATCTSSSHTGPVGGIPRQGSSRQVPPTSAQLKSASFIKTEKVMQNVREVFKKLADDEDGIACYQKIKQIITGMKVVLDLNPQLARGANMNKIKNPIAHMAKVVERMEKKHILQFDHRTVFSQIARAKVEIVQMNGNGEEEDETLNSNQGDSILSGESNNDNPPIDLETTGQPGSEADVSIIHGRVEPPEVQVVTLAE